MKVLLTVTTGRPTYVETINQLIENFMGFQHNTTTNLGLLINYDPTYGGYTDTDFKFESTLADQLLEVMYLGPKDTNKYSEILKEADLPKDLIQEVTRVTGYGHKKNLATLIAIQNNYDSILYWDDDEYPVVCSGDCKAVTWRKTDILGEHIKALNSGADVSFGYWSGYVSPIPARISKILSSQVAIQLAKAIAPGSDVITEKSFIQPQTSFVFVDKCPEQKEIQTEFGGKWISGGNLMLSVKSIASGIIPALYTPNDSRGDDTILSTGLEKAKVVAVPAGIFHDAFNEFNGIRIGDYPKVIEPPQSDDQKLKETCRFAAALSGWLAYAPLLVKIRFNDRSDEIIHQIAQSLNEVETDLFREWPELKLALNSKLPSEIFIKYASIVDQQYQTLSQLRRAWTKLIKNLSKKELHNAA